MHAPPIDPPTRFPNHPYPPPPPPTHTNDPPHLPGVPFQVDPIASDSHMTQTGMNAYLLTSHISHLTSFQHLCKARQSIALKLVYI